MILLLCLPFLIQGLIIGLDEFYCHHRRGLPRWERIGHPVDTAGLLLCFGICVFLTPTQMHLYALIVASLTSCFLITKDEFVHQKLCDVLELWLHAILFVVHPMVLIASGLLWFYFEVPFILNVQFSLLSVFLVYQIFYWNIYAKTQSE